MAWYIFVFVIIIFLMIINKMSSKRTHTVIFQIAMIILVFFACFRGTEVGKDTYSYIRLFHRIANCNWKDLYNFSNNTGYEIGYVVYNKCLSLITTDDQIITIANSGILFILLAKLLKKLPNPIEGLYLFITFGLYQASFNIVSSMIASLMIINELECIQQKNWKRYVSCVLFASFFHRSVLIFLVLYVIGNIEINMKRLIVIVSASFIFSRLYNQLYFIIVRFIPSQYIRYLERAEGDNGIILIFHSVILACILGTQYLTSSCSEIVNQNTKIYLWGTILELGAFVFSYNALVFSRVAYLFMPTFVMYILFAIQNISYSNNRKILKNFLLIVIGIQYVLRLNINNIGSSMPYEFFFFQ